MVGSEDHRSTQEFHMYSGEGIDAKVFNGGVQRTFFPANGLSGHFACDSTHITSSN